MFMSLKNPVLMCRYYIKLVDEIHGTYESSMMICILMTYVVHYYYRAGGIHGIIDGTTKIPEQRKKQSLLLDMFKAFD